MPRFVHLLAPSLRETPAPPSQPSRHHHARRRGRLSSLRGRPGTDAAAGGDEDLRELADLERQQARRHNVGDGHQRPPPRRHGAATQQVLASVVRTARQRNLDLPALFATMLRAPDSIVPDAFGLPPPPASSAAPERAR